MKAVAFDSLQLDRYPEGGKSADRAWFTGPWRIPTSALPITRRWCRRGCAKRAGTFYAAQKGQDGISIGQTSDKIIGAIIKSGAKRLGQKSKGKRWLYSIDAPALVNTIASGEIAASPGDLSTHTLLAASKARREWVPMDLAACRPTSAARRIAANPPHPHAALLMADFLLSQGRALLEKPYYGAAPGLWFKKCAPSMV